MKPKFTDAVISYLLKGGVLLETKGVFETDVNIPVTQDEGPDKTITIRIKCQDLTIRTVKEHRNEDM